jgi:hypothetical protein
MRYDEIVVFGPKLNVGSFRTVVSADPTLSEARGAIGFSKRNHPGYRYTPASVR